MNARTYLILLAISFQLLGTICLIVKPAIKYLRGFIFGNRIIRKEVEDEAIGTSFNRLASEDRQKNLSDSIARGFISTYKSTFFGFLFMILGFVIEIITLFL